MRPTDQLVVTTLAAAVGTLDYEQIYRTAYKDVYRFLLGMTRSRDDADELTADVFERAFREWTRGNLPVERVLPWLLLTGRRLATDRWRRARRRAAALIRVTPTKSQPSDQERSEFMMWLDAVAVVLPNRQRAVLLLRYQADLSDSDIAQIIGISESGVRSSVARALATLRAHEELL